MEKILFFLCVIISNTLTFASKQLDGNLLVIGDYGVSVYETDITDTEGAQGIVDRKNSAALLTIHDRGECKVIADHKNQGFDIIKTLEKGDTVFLKLNGIVESYVVEKVDKNGKNDNGIYFSDGSDAFAGDDSILRLYTCNEDWHHVTVVECKKDNITWIMEN